MFLNNKSKCIVALRLTECQEVECKGMHFLKTTLCLSFTSAGHTTSTIVLNSEIICPHLSPFVHVLVIFNYCINSGYMYCWFISASDLERGIHIQYFLYTVRKYPSVWWFMSLFVLLAYIREQSFKDHKSQISILYPQIQCDDETYSLFLHCIYDIQSNSFHHDRETVACFGWDVSVEASDESAAQWFLFTWAKSDTGWKLTWTAEINAVSQTLSDSFSHLRTLSNTSAPLRECQTVSDKHADKSRCSVNWVVSFVETHGCTLDTVNMWENLSYKWCYSLTY